MATTARGPERFRPGDQRLPPGDRFPYGRRHREREEVSVVVRGSGRVKLDDEIVEVRTRDAVRAPPGTARDLGENPRDDVEGRRDGWAD